MPLQRSLVELPIQTGLSQKTDSRLIQEGAQTGLVNLVQDKIGALQKRPGILDLGIASYSPWGNFIGQGSYADARLIPSEPGGVAQVSNGRLWSRGSDNVAYDLDAIESFIADSYGVVTTDGITSFDIASNGSKILIAWIALNSSGNLEAFYAVYDAVTFDCVVVATSFGPALAAYNPQIVKLATIGTATGIAVFQYGGTLAGYAFNFATLTWSSITLTTSGGITDCNHTLAVSGTTFYGCYDLCAIPGSTTAFVLAYGNQSAAGGKPQVTLYELGPTGADLVSSSIQGGSPTSNYRIHGVGVNSDGNRIWCTYALNDTSKSNVRALALSVAGLSTSTPTDTLAWAQTSSNLPNRMSVHAILPSSAAIASNYITDQQLTYFGTMNAAGTVINGSRSGLSLASKVFELNGQQCALYLYSAGNPTVNNLAVNPSYFVCSYSENSGATAFDLVPQATVSPRVAKIGQLGNLNSSSVPAVIVSQVGAKSTQSVVTAGLVIRSAAQQGGIDLFDVYYNHSLWRPAVLGGATYLSGGIPCEYDGQRVTEIGFTYQPPGTSTVTFSASTGGQLSSYTYTYGIVYEWRDAIGQRKQSPPTFVSYANNNAAGIASVACPAINLTLCQDWESNYQPPVGIAIYRDTATAPGTLCRLFVGDVPATNQNVFNGTSTYTDSNSDATILYNEQLYTTGGVLPSNIPPSFHDLITHNSRLVGIGGDGLIWFSTKWDEGSTQPYFSDDLAQAIGTQGRPTALATMDSNLIIFTPDSIWLISGDGPASDGTGNTWTPPQKITADVGCTTDWRSTVIFSQGVVFQSEAKLYVLSRGLEAQYFSAPVEDLLIANPVVVSAVNHAARNELRFVCKPTEVSSTGVVLNFNYVTQTWSEFLYYDTDLATTGADIDSAIDVQGTWYHTTFTGRMYMEGTGSAGSDNYYDCYTGPVGGGQWIVGTRETAWLKGNGIQGFGRFWNAMVLETDFSPHDLFIAAGYNYSASYVDFYTFTASQIASFSTPQPQMQCHLVQQKSESVRFKIYDGPPTGVAATSGQGANIISVTAEAGVKKGRFRIPEAQSQ